jgi:hypothetical protein
MNSNAQTTLTTINMLTDGDTFQGASGETFTIVKIVLISQAAIVTVKGSSIERLMTPSARVIKIG